MYNLLSMMTFCCYLEVEIFNHLTTFTFTNLFIEVNSLSDHYTTSFPLHQKTLKFPPYSL